MYNKKSASCGSVPKLGQTQFDSIFYQLLHKLDQQEQSQCRLSMATELRSIEFWRSIIAECLGTFFYVFLVCAVHISWTGSLIAHQPNCECRVFFLALLDQPKIAYLNRFRLTIS